MVVVFKSRVQSNRQTAIAQPHLHLLRSHLPKKWSMACGTDFQIDPAMEVPGPRSHEIFKMELCSTSR